jgi:hypothetical protein
MLNTTQVQLNVPTKVQGQIEIQMNRLKGVCDELLVAWESVIERCERVVRPEQEQPDRLREGEKRLPMSLMAEMLDECADKLEGLRHNMDQFTSRVDV